MDRATDPQAEREVTARDGAVYVLGPLRPGEEAELFDLFAAVVEAGEGYPQAPPLTEEVFAETWIRPVRIVIGARLAEGGPLRGAYHLKPNFPGRASHIANAGYLVAAGARGRGIGRLLVEDSIGRAPLVGFRAIQFNLVVASNPARALYEELGWREIGRLPDAIGGEEAVIYWRSVGPAPT